MMIHKTPSAHVPRISLVVVALLFVRWPTLQAEPTTAADPCAECHEAEAKQWAESAHASAIDDAFLKEWQIEGRAWECLVCHATEYDRKKGTYSTPGITCESCHGTIRPEHPVDERMTLPVTSEVCQTCHAMTFGEWRVSAHGQKNIRCFDCHRMHRMELRRDDPDQLCGACHTERLRDFTHATHRVKGLHCVTCHMPQAPGAGPKIAGTGVRTHTYGVGGETCSQCHREMVHGGSQIETLKQEVARLQESDPTELRARAETLQAEVGEEHSRAESTKRVLLWALPAVFLLGGAAGSALAQLRLRRAARRGSKPARESGQ